MAKELMDIMEAGMYSFGAIGVTYILAKNWYLKIKNESKNANCEAIARSEAALLKVQEEEKRKTLDKELELSKNKDYASLKKAHFKEYNSAKKHYLEMRTTAAKAILKTRPKLANESYEFGLLIDAIVGEFEFDSK